MLKQCIFDLLHALNPGKLHAKNLLSILREITLLILYNATIIRNMILPIMKHL